MTPVPAGAEKSTKNAAVHDRRAHVECMQKRLIKKTRRHLSQAILCTGALESRFMPLSGDMHGNKRIYLFRC